MQTLNNSTPPARNGQPTKAQQFSAAFIQTTKGTIKYRIRFLRATYGDCLNTWPRCAQDEYHNLARQLRQIDAGVQR